MFSESLFNDIFTVFEALLQSMTQMTGRFLYTVSRKHQISCFCMAEIY